MTRQSLYLTGAALDIAQSFGIMHVSKGAGQSGLTRHL